MLGDGQLQEDAVDAGVLVVLLYCRLELLLAAIGGEPRFEADETELGAGGEFAPDVDFAGRVVAD